MVFLHALQHKMRYAQCTSSFSILLYTCFMRMTRNRLAFFVLRHVFHRHQATAFCCDASHPAITCVYHHRLQQLQLQQRNDVKLRSGFWRAPHILFGSSTSFLFVDFLFGGKLQYCKERRQQHHRQRKMLIVKLCRIDYT